MESGPIEISDEAFNQFHSIDRELYTRLVHALGRDVPKSIQVMAFWMWLEKKTKDMNLFNRLLSLPAFPHLNTLADETVVCLHCITTNTFLYAAAALVLLPRVVNDQITITLRMFHENRVVISREIAKISNTVCARAFRDISLPLLQVQKHHMNNQRMDEVPPDDRTVFLTFSKGFPITGDEVTEFFTRRFGDFIEELIMQDVEGEEQVLYARMVARSAAWIDKIVGGNKVTFFINGKQVRARKYVKKHNHFPPPTTRAQDLSSLASSVLLKVR